MRVAGETAGEALARWRQCRGLSLRRLGELTNYAHVYLWQIERGLRPPRPEVMARCDLALSAGGELIDAVEAAPRSDPGGRAQEAADRLDHARRAPRFIDAAVIGHLGQTLAAQRRLEDTLGARELLSPSVAQVRMIEALARHASRPSRKSLLGLAAEWAQFVGWMHRDVGDQASAQHWYDRAAEWAHCVGGADMIASVLSMKSHLAWSAREPGPAVDLAEASLSVAGASAAVRALAAQQLARGCALAGDGDDTERWLDEAQRLTSQAVDNPGGQPPWVYFHNPARLDMQRALAYTELGRGPHAVDLLRSGLRTLDTSLTRDRGWHLARLAVAHAVAGDLPESVSALTDAAQIAAHTGSFQTVADLHRAAAILSRRWPKDPALAKAKRLIQNLAAGGWLSSGAPTPHM